MFFKDTEALPNSPRPRSTRYFPAVLNTSQHKFVRCTNINRARFMRRSESTSRRRTVAPSSAIPGAALRSQKLNSSAIGSAVISSNGSRETIRGGDSPRLHLNPQRMNR